MEKRIERSPMIERLEGEKVERIRKVLAFIIHLMVFVLVCLGIFGLIFLISFLVAFFFYLVTGEAGLGMRYWLPGLMSVFLIFFEFPKINKFWEILIFKKTSF